MSSGASQIAARIADAAMRPFVAADVGGTHARVALVRPRAASGGVVLEQYSKYVCADYPSLAVILRHFIESLHGEPIESCAIACAGYCLDGTMVNTNLPWTVSLQATRDEVGLRTIEFVNDFEALAYAARRMDAGDTTLLTKHARYSDDAPIVIVGPGTGLGAAVRIPAANKLGGNRHVVLPTEAGQAAFAPSSDREIEILRVLRRTTSHVSIEHVLSGPGLVNVYSALAILAGQQTTMSAPAAVTVAAASGSDALAREALDVFCGLMGSVLGDLVLLYGAQGGAYLAGGILPQIKTHLMSSNFLERFLDKGAMRQILERVPISLIEHHQLGVIGAANWFLSERVHE